MGPAGEASDTARASVGHVGTAGVGERLASGVVEAAHSGFSVVVGSPESVFCPQEV